MNIMFYEYMKQKCFGGRSKLSRIADGIIFRALIALIIYILIPKSAPRVLLTIGFTLMAHVALCISSNIRLKRTIKREKEIIRKQLQRDAILLMPYDMLQSKLDDDVALIQQYEPVKVGDVLPWIKLGYRKICAISSISNEAMTFIKRMNEPLILISADEFISDVTVTDKDIEKYVITMMDSKKTRTKPIKRLADTSAGKYVLLGLVLIVLSFSVKLSLYYRLIANLCFILAVSFYALRTRNERKTMKEG